MTTFTSISTLQILGALLVFLGVAGHKQLSDKFVSLISRVLHVRYSALLKRFSLRAVELRSHFHRYISLFDILSSIMKAKRHYRLVNINGRMGKGMSPSFWKGTRTVTYGPRNSASSIGFGRA